MTTLRITLDNGDVITTKFIGTAADYLRYCGGEVVTNTIADDGEHEKTEVHKIINVEEAQQYEKQYFA